MSVPRLTKRRLRRLLVGSALLLPLLAATYAASYMLRFAGEPTGTFLPLFYQTVAWVLAVKMGTAMWFKLHEGAKRYVTFRDVLVLTQAITCSTVGITLADAFLLTGVTIPRSVILLDWGCTIVAVGAVWAAPRMLRDGGWQLLSQRPGIPALIVGANNSGEGLLRAIRRTPGLEYQPVGFVDDRANLQDCRIDGVPVVGITADVARLVQQYGVEEVLITAGELPGKQVRQLVDVAQDRSFRVKVLPSYEQLLRGHVAVRPRPVAIEDILQRPSVDLDLESIRDWLAGQTLLVTGSAGSIGSEICRQLLHMAPKKLVLVDRAETGQFYVDREMRQLANSIDVETCIADMTDDQRMTAVFAHYCPDIVFHAAAYKHVPLMELHPGEAVKNIVGATRNLVDLADEHGASAFVMISTDKAVNPTSVMGACKRLAEQYVQARSTASACRFVTVRFGNVLDSAGSVVPIFREQIARGGPVTVTHPAMVRYFMLIPEAAQLVIQAGAMGRGGEIFVLDMGEPVRIVDLAKDMIRLSGLRLGHDIEIEFVGLRPGEKLYEELYCSSELHQRTAHPKIMVATGQQEELVRVIHDISRLTDVSDGPRDVILQALHEIVPLHRHEVTTTSRAAA